MRATRELARVDDAEEIVVAPARVLFERVDQHPLPVRSGRQVDPHPRDVHRALPDRIDPDLRKEHADERIPPIRFRQGKHEQPLAHDVVDHPADQLHLQRDIRGAEIFLVRIEVREADLHDVGARAERRNYLRRRQGRGRTHIDLPRFDGANDLRRLRDIRRDVNVLADCFPDFEDFGQRGWAERLLHVLRVDDDTVGVHKARNFLPFVAADQAQRIDGPAVARAGLRA